MVNDNEVLKVNRIYQTWVCLFFCYAFELAITQDFFNSVVWGERYAERSANITKAVLNAPMFLIGAADGECSPNALVKNLLVLLCASISNVAGTCHWVNLI